MLSLNPPLKFNMIIPANSITTAAQQSNDCFSLKKIAANTPVVMGDILATELVTDAGLSEEPIL